MNKSFIFTFQFECKSWNVKRVSPSKWQTSQAVALAEQLESEVYRRPLQNSWQHCSLSFTNQYYFTRYLPFTLPCFMIFSSFQHDTHDTLVILSWHCDTLVTSCYDICGTEARTQAPRGRNFRRNCSVLAKMSSMDSHTSLWPWTGIHISREDPVCLNTLKLFEATFFEQAILSIYKKVNLIWIIISAACNCNKKWNHQNIWTTR